MKAPEVKTERSVVPLENSGINSHKAELSAGRIFNKGANCDEDCDNR